MAQNPGSDHAGQKSEAYEKNGRQEKGQVTMKGVKIIRARPSNVLDAYDLYKKAHREGVLRHPQPTEEDLKEYYFVLLEELAQPTNVLLLAQKGRQFLGMIHMTVNFRPVGRQKLTAFVKAAYVIQSKRKLGVGKQLADAAMSFCRQSRIQSIEFLCDDKMLEFWSKKRGAEKVANYAVIEV